MITKNSSNLIVPLLSVSNALNICTAISSILSLGSGLNDSYKLTNSFYSLLKILKLYLNLNKLMYLM